MASLIFTVLFSITILSLQRHSIIAQSVAESDSLSSSILFATDLLPLIAENKSTQNIVYSPASIYTSLVLTYFGAEGSTATELRKVLKLNRENKLIFAFKYGRFIRTVFNKTKAEDDDDDAPQLKMANRLFADNKFKIIQLFNEISQNFLYFQVENVDFSQHSTAAAKINKWVEERTENKIKNIMQPEAIDDDTTAVLVSAMYLKAKWLTPFSTRDTSKGYFHVSRNNIVRVDTMNADGYFSYIELPELNATALGLPYKNSDISMVIILPNEDSDLQSLEKLLVGKDLNSIISKMEGEFLHISLPKFRIEFATDLKKTLQKMGCSTMFGKNAYFKFIFENSTSVKVTEIKHKAYLDCNEGGSEAATASYVSFAFKSVLRNWKTFYANRPFFFAIRSSTAVFFAGHVAQFS